MTVRRQARELTLQLLFQYEFSQDQNIPPQKQVENFKKSFSFNDDVWEYTYQIFDGVLKRLDQIDQTISDKSQNWTSSRMALVDRNVLRIAIFEIQFFSQEVPPKVAVNEAIEISKKYSGSDSHQFINGILGKLIEA